GGGSSGLSRRSLWRKGKTGGIRKVYPMRHQLAIVERGTPPRGVRERFLELKIVGHSPTYEAPCRSGCARHPPVETPRIVVAPAARLRTRLRLDALNSPPPGFRSNPRSGGSWRRGCTRPPLASAPRRRTPPPAAASPNTGRWPRQLPQDRSPARSGRSS